MTTTLKVSGLTCEHCVRAVREELLAVDGVEGVDVDLVSGGDSTVTITGPGEVSRAAVEEALDEAGEYRLVD